MAKFVSFPGTAGSYASTDDINQFPSDTAHAQQALRWKASVSGGNVVAVTLSTDITPLFGDNTVKVDITTATGTGNAGMSSLSNTFNTVLPSTQYTYSVWIYSLTPWSGALGVEDYNAGAFVSGSFDSQAVSHGGTGWERVEQVRTTRGTADSSTFYVRPADVATPFALYCDEFQLEQAAASTLWVPSFRIVGVADVVYDLAPDPWDVAGDTFVNYVGNSQPIMYLRSANRMFIAWPGAAGASVTIGLSGSDRHQVRVKSDPASGFLWSIDGGADTAAGVAYTADWSGVVGGVTLGHREGGSGVGMTGDGWLMTWRDGVDGPIVAQFDAEDVTI